MLRDGNGLPLLTEEDRIIWPVDCGVDGRLDGVDERLDVVVIEKLPLILLLFPLVVLTRDDSVVLVLIVGVVERDDMIVAEGGCFELDLLVGVVGRDGSITVFGLGFLLIGVEERDEGLLPDADADAEEEEEEEGFLLLIVEKLAPLLMDLAAVFHPLFLCENSVGSLILLVIRSGFEPTTCCCKISTLASHIWL